MPAQKMEVAVPCKSEASVCRVGQKERFASEVAMRTGSMGTSIVESIETIRQVTISAISMSHSCLLALHSSGDSSAGQSSGILLVAGDSSFKLFCSTLLRGRSNGDCFIADI